MDSPGLEISALETKLKALYLKRHKQQRLPSTPLLKRINRELAMHHNDENYEMEYIRKRFDYRCPVETLPLPRGKACHLQYKSNVERLHASMQSLLAEVDTKRQELLQALKESDKTEGVQDVILSELNATLDKYHQVQAELYHFLEKTEPIDVEAFHARLGPLLQEKLRIMRESRMAQIQTLQEAKANGVSSEASTIQDVLSAETDLWTDPRIPDMLRQYSDSALVEEAPIFLSLGDIHLGKKLGEGTYGKTYTCTLLQQTTNVVVKMPLAQELQDNSIAKKAVPEMEKVVENYNQEFTNFERMMEPVLFTTYTRQGEHWVTLKTDSVAENHQEYFALQQEMLKIQGHPGYKHMHRLLHFQIAEGTVPLIFSEPCDETLQGLLRQLYLASSPFLRLKEYKLWWTIARQLTSAMEFMLVERRFVNVDIKPMNVLYCAQDNRFVLADYGMCLSSEEPSSTFANQTDLGTHFYNPKTLGQLQNAGDLAIFQFAACMLCIVDYSQTPRPQCIELIGTHIHTSRSDSEEEYDHIHTASRWVHDGTLPITPLIASVPALAPLAAILKPGNEALIRPSFSDFQKQLSQVQE